MSGNLGNPFMSNTPTSSPLKGKNKLTDSLRVSKRNSASPANSNSSGGILGITASPTRRPRTTGSVIYADRYLPTRTEVSLHAISSIGNSSNVPTLTSVDTENQVESQRERNAHETFDTVLKNEIFGELLTKDAISKETSIDRIKNTTDMIQQSSTSSSWLATPSPERRRQQHDMSENGGESSSISAPVTPRRLFPSTQQDDDLMYRSSTNSSRGATLLSYSHRSSTRRPSTASLLQSQFFDPVSPVRPESKQLLLSPSKQTRKISKVPYRVLDAPSLADDFYYDLIDWSSTDMLAVALGKSIFLTNNATGEVFHLCDTEMDFTSLSWVGAGSHLAVGQRDGLVDIYDVTKKKCIRTMSGQTDRVSCLSWNNYILSSGSRDRSILHRDVRMPDPFFERLETHTQEVCGLKWNVEENKLASGGNDNIVNVYDGTSRTPTVVFQEHTAAVKAIAWSPHKRSTLATGGGTADKKLKIWNVNTSTKISDRDTGSQICNMIWSRNTDEIVTSHGYSKYNLTLWDFPSMDPIAILKGHSFRVLHLTLSADGTTVVSGAGDETLRYWKLFDKPKHKIPTNSSVIFNSVNRIR
ncbi:similar to Saccharomyces cerevisiae YGL003C CDH1 Cell-cycle regulated activator of the anaphase-promoting complex/cyclosome (APC/C) [Maudiozyma saulgeensis]|uniref:Similar to Saccharomyces cerevisiae YGL003C CDH1 Cell-cycle regulated activator of the anaphase-promoting complex/cyclosome (APC/C) n=1 Tax=Maudiozyma saulgeensis TaxID=1789683 RepID=A0A1X7RAY2_9SACH|nr:similar to Saccharomyces cerevisiae YGL003C CDH1 Cell-cycle regulated activator of the anaphase-promoting complex/cyclosome (APC/C) [Kazachstania saulgeensis]